MPQLEIKNIGAIKDATITAKRFTLIIGPQSSGKSTIAKLLSFCAWMEKQALIDNGFENFDKAWFDENLLQFHQIQSYMGENSSFHYKSSVLNIDFLYKDHTSGVLPQLTWAHGKDSAPVTKVAYIPSERNLVSIPNIASLKLPSNYIRSFIFDWFAARRNYTPTKALDILNLKVKYHHTEGNGLDIITLNDSELSLQLEEVSSGLQSLVPLHIMVDYLTKQIFSARKEFSYSEFERHLKQLEDLITNSHKVNMASIDFGLNDDKTLIGGHISWMVDNSHMIIEEPEQNLFPDAQRDLVEYIVKSAGDKHQVLMTTHSPYILLALNNMILRAHVKDNIPESEREAMLKDKVLLSGKETALYQITNEGSVQHIQDEDGLLERNYLNSAYRALSDEFSDYLNYYSSDD